MKGKHQDSHQHLSLYYSLITGTFLCSWWPFFDFFLANISIFNLVNIAIDRYRAVLSPFSYKQDNSGLNSPQLKCAGAWAASCLLSLPILSGDVDPDTCYINMKRVPWLVVYLPVICFILPSLIIIILYVIIAVTILRKTKNRARYINRLF